MGLGPEQALRNMHDWMTYQQDSAYWKAERAARMRLLDRGVEPELYYKGAPVYSDAQVAKEMHTNPAST